MPPIRVWPQLSQVYWPVSLPKNTLPTITVVMSAKYEMKLKIQPSNLQFPDNTLIQNWFCDICVTCCSPDLSWHHFESLASLRFWRIPQLTKKFQGNSPYILCATDLTKMMSFSVEEISSKPDHTKEWLPSLAASLPMCLNGPLFLTPAKDLRAGLTEWAAAPHSGPGRSCLPLPTLFQVRAALQLCLSACACVRTKAGSGGGAQPGLIFSFVKCQIQQILPFFSLLCLDPPCPISFDLSARNSKIRFHVVVVGVRTSGVRGFVSHHRTVWQKGISERPLCSQLLKRVELKERHDKSTYFLFNKTWEEFRRMFVKDSKLPLRHHRPPQVNHVGRQAKQSPLDIEFIQPVYHSLSFYSL